MKGVKRSRLSAALAPNRGTSFLLALFLSLILSRIGLAQQLDSTAWGVGPSGSVDAVVRSGNTVYVGGSFAMIGRNSGGAVPLDIATARGPNGYPHVAGRVNAVVADGADGWFVGGWFPAVDGHPHANLAHVRPGGVDEGWTAGADNEVFALSLAGSTLYVGGDFDSLGGVARSHVAAVDAMTGTPTAWNPGANDHVATILATDTQVFIGGRFTSAGGVGHRYVAAVDAAIYLGGWFSAIGGLTRRTLAAVDTTTGAPTQWAPFTDFVVETMIVHDGKIFVGGPFGHVNGAERGGIAAIMPSGDLAAWAPNANGAVHSLVAVDSTIYVAGSFLSIGGQSRSSLAALDARTGVVRDWNPSPDGGALGLSTNGHSLDVVGAFGRMGNWAHSGIASFTLGRIPSHSVPRTLFLAQNAPNPSTSATLVSYVLPTAMTVSLVVFDAQGRRMTPLISRVPQSAGPHQVTVQTSGWRPGCYFYRLEAAGVRATKKMVVLR